MSEKSANKPEEMLFGLIAIFGAVTLHILIRNHDASLPVPYIAGMLLMIIGVALIGRALGVPDRLTGCNDEEMADEIRRINPDGFNRAKHSKRNGTKGA